jgi:hypothetical protein
MSEAPDRRLPNSFWTSTYEERQVYIERLREEVGCMPESLDECLERMQREELLIAISMQRLRENGDVLGETLRVISASTTEAEASERERSDVEEILEWIDADEERIRGAEMKECEAETISRTDGEEKQS